MILRIALAALALAHAGASMGAVSQQVGINAAIRNKVETAEAGSSAYRRAVLKARVGLGDRIVTAQASMLQIRLLDRTNFTVGANARVTIDRFVYDPAKSASAIGASVAKGAFRFMSGKPVKNMPGQTKITTPVASIGVRGTIFEGVVGPDAIRIAEREMRGAMPQADPEAATLVVLRGPVATAKSPSGAIDVTAGGVTVPVERPNLAVFIPRIGAPPSKPFPLSSIGLLQLVDLIDVDLPLSGPPDEGSLASRIVALHNHERALVGSPPLAWDPEMADSAMEHALLLAKGGPIRHSERKGREDQRENLIYAPTGLRTIDQLVGMWTREKSLYRPGIFPDVSRDGEWSSTAHFTQMVWSRTERIGCAMSHSRFDYLVCRYSPPGNRDGERPY